MKTKDSVGRESWEERAAGVSWNLAFHHADSACQGVAWRIGTGGLWAVRHSESREIPPLWGEASWTTPVQIIMTAVISYILVAFACGLIRKIPKVGKYLT